MTTRSVPGGRRGARRARALAARAASLLAVLLAVSLGTFLLLELLPGDPAVAIIGQENATAENLARVRRDLRLDEPIHVRYADWVGGVVRGDLGTSYQTRQPVSEAIAAALPVTAQLAVLGLVLSLPAVPLALWAARSRRLGGWLAGGVPLVALAVPSFVLAMVLIWVFSVRLGWLPATGWSRLSDGVGANLRTALLPSLTLAAGNLGVLTRVLHGELTGTMQQEFVRVARSKGLTRRRVLIGHVLKPSLLPAVTVVGLQFGSMLAGAVVVESIFAVPGMGRLLVDAIYERDLVIVQGVTLVLAAGYVVVNAGVDALHAALDPRTTRVAARA